jgi:hypothetical protein
MVSAVQCTNCQSAVPGGAAQCPVCGNTIAPARRIITGAPAVVAPPRRRHLAPAAAPAAAPRPPAPAPLTTVAPGPGPAAQGAPRAPQAPGRRRGAGMHLTGHVTSTVTFDQREIGSGPTYMLMVLGLIGLMVVCALLILKLLVMLLVPLIVVLLVISVVLNRAAGFGTLKSTIGFGAGAAGRAFPGLPGRPGSRPLDIARFRIVDGGGVPHDCEILGELRAPPPRLNDDVEVVGRRRRDGVVQVRRLRNQVSGTSLRGHVPLSVSAAQTAPWVLVGLIVVAVLLLVSHGS